jgi:hypothetical protein
MARPRLQPAVRLDTDTALAAILAVLVADREDRLYADDPKREPIKTEVVRSLAGLENSEIVPLVARSADSVQKTVKRGRS